ncbi:MAG: hypothetical protein MUD12_09285 [Spirochaetes bacterium]|jgi:hypothetical protein|nr:hypothetical protein [Spirochaetota bacterium]
MKILIAFSFIIFFLTVFVLAGGYNSSFGIDRSDWIIVIAASAAFVLASIITDSVMKKKAQ